MQITSAYSHSPVHHPIETFVHSVGSFDRVFYYPSFVAQRRRYIDFSFNNHFLFTAQCAERKAFTYPVSSL